MRFSFIATALALALTVDAASSVNRRELRPAASKCATSIKAVSDYLPSFVNSIEKISSYTSVIAAHSKEDKVERKIRAAVRECNKINRSSTDEEVTAFIEIMQELVGNIKKTSNALNNKKDVLDDIPLARPLIEDSLLTVYEDTVALEDHLIEICADKYKNEFRGYINEINGALESSLDLYEIEY